MGSRECCSLTHVPTEERGELREHYLGLVVNLPIPFSLRVSLRVRDTFRGASEQQHPRCSFYTAR